MKMARRKCNSAVAAATSPRRSILLPSLAPFKARVANISKSVQVICAHLNESEGLRLTGKSLPRRAVRSCRPVTTGIRAQISGNLGKRLESRCRSSRRLAAIEESAMASNYNLRSASGKEPARPEEASPSYDQGNLEETVNRLVADVATHEEALGGAAETFEGFREEMKLMREQMAESVAMSRSLSDLVKTLQDEVAGLRASNQRLLRTNSASSSQERTSRVDVQRPAKYSGSRDARAIDNFLFQVDYYLDLQNVVEEDLKIKTAAMLLEGDAVAWWRRKMLDIENGDCTIRTFDDFRKQLKGYFMPVDAERHAYRLVANLKQTGALRDYIRAYQKVMLDVPMMPEKDKLHWFIIGLQSWAQTDVERSNPETLEQAYVAAERLADTQRKSYTDTFKATKKSDHGGKRDDRRDHNRNEQVSQKPTERKTFFRKDYTGPPRDVNCWVCGRKHLARVCPKRVKPTGQVNAARATEDETEEGQTRMGAAQAINAVQNRAVSSSLVDKELMYLNVTLNGMSTVAMVDSGATHNFVSEEEAERVGLRPVPQQRTIKAVNSPAKAVLGEAKGVTVQIQGWTGVTNFSVVPLDDFKVILGLEFFRSQDAMIVSRTNTVMIMGADQTHAVHCHSIRNKSQPMLSAMQLKRGRAPSSRRASDRQLDQILRHKVNYLGEPKRYLVKWVDNDQPTWEYAFRFKRSHPEEVRIYHEAASAEDGA
ncbi:hypothetical protein EJ110_NYTH40500 [Nymphaea thermarum]|nr:hypothetical protein EJ110_NYTH40500 [Nymphaea thermarum]